MCENPGVYYLEGDIKQVLDPVLSLEAVDLPAVAAQDPIISIRKEEVEVETKGGVIFDLSRVIED
jgi:hypothetical protein